MVKLRFSFPVKVFAEIENLEKIKNFQNVAVFRTLIIQKKNEQVPKNSKYFDDLFVKQIVLKITQNIK